MSSPGASAETNPGVTGSDPQRQTDRIGWEYTTIVLTGGFMGRHKEELKRSALRAELANLGADGWELCWVLPEQALQHEKDGHVLIFKRPAGA